MAFKFNPLTSKFDLVNISEAGTDEKVKYDIADPTAGYVADKIIAGTGISVAEGTAGDENKLVIENTLDLTPYALSEDVKKYSGFENRTDSTIAMSGNNFEITTATSYNVYFNGIGKKTVNATLSIEITEDQNITYIYLDWDSVGSVVRINKSTSFWDIKDGVNIPLAIVFKDGATYAATDERHGYNRNLEWHNWAHNTIGAMYYSGLGGTFTNTTLSIDSGVIYDEDIRFAIAPKTECRLWYRNALSGMRTIAPSTTPYKADGTGVLQYDNGSGILQEVGPSQYSAQWVYASNDATYPIYVVLGQEVGSLAVARNSTAPIINLSTAEWKLLYRVIYRRVGTTPTYIESADFRSVQTGVPTNYNPTNHSSLTGRDATESHPATAISNEPAGNIVAINVQTALNELDTEKQEKFTTQSLTLLSANWDVNNEQTLAVTGVTVTSLNMISINDLAQGDFWADANIYAISQGVDEITFKCETTPTDNISFSVAIFE